MAWTIWWDTRNHPEITGWNTAVALTEGGALDMAGHFLKLKFFVFTIRRPDGTVYMDEAQIDARFNSPIRNAPPSA
jgi:hypothetical protein